MAPQSRLGFPFDQGFLTLPEVGQTLVLRPSGPDALAPLQDAKPLCWQSFYPFAQSLTQAGFEVADTLPQDMALAVVFLTRAKAENQANVALALAALRDGGTLVVDGAKTDGIDALWRALRKRLEVTDSYTKAHGRVFWLTKSGEDVLEDWRAPLDPAPNRDGFHTCAGVFSADGIDPGSAQLAEYLAGELKGNGADLGAGWGFLSAQALATNETIQSLTLIEAERRALDCARLNITDPRARFEWQDATRFTPENPFDFIIMNPPFHQGRTPDASLGQRFIAQAAATLTPKGSLWLVANRQLPYEATLDSHFAKWCVLGEEKGFKTIHASHPKRKR